MKAVIILFVFFISIYISQAQNKDSTRINKSFKKVRIDIARGGLHCPILGPQLEEKINNIEGVKDVIMNSSESYIKFLLPENTTINNEYLIKIASDLGYLKQDIKITISK